MTSTSATFDNQSAFRSFKTSIMSRQIDFTTRIRKMQLQHEVSKNVDFSRCHTIWSNNSLDLRPVSGDNLTKYYAIAIPAMTMNIAVLCCGLRCIWKDRHIQGMLNIFLYFYSV